MDQHHDRQRAQSYRPRRGPDRRGPGRRPPAQQSQDRSARDQVDVEQIMRDIRGRIAQRQEIDLSTEQIQDLAARRLESILDPRAIKPSLLEGLRRSAAAPTDPVDTVPNEPTFSFEDTTLYDSHRGALRVARRLLNPLLKLLFNPNPLIRALHLQAKLNVEAVERNAERDRRQTEWNALHYEIVQRLVTEVSRASLELQALSMRVEALGARIDFNDRRVSALEASTHRSRPQGRHPEPVAVGPVVDGAGAPTDSVIASGDTQTPDATRRRRRRRRGRRSGSGSGDHGLSAPPETSGTASTSGGSAPEAPPAANQPHSEAGEATTVPDSAPPEPSEVRESSPAPTSAPVEPEHPPLPLLPLDTERRED